MLTQVAAGLVAGGVLDLIASGRKGFVVTGHLLPNSFGDHSPGGFSLLAALVTEIVLTALFLYIILGATDTRAPQGFARIAIGLGLTLIHLISIPVTNTSVNPARSTGVAFFNGNGAPAQLWLFLGGPHHRCRHRRCDLRHHHRRTPRGPRRLRRCCGRLTDTWRNTTHRSRG